MADAAPQISPRNPIPAPSGLTMDQLVEKGGENLFTYLDDPEPGQPPVSPPPQKTPSQPKADGQRQPEPPAAAEEGADLTPEQKVFDVLKDMDLMPDPPAASGQEEEADSAPSGDTPTQAVDLQQLSTTLGIDPEQLVLAEDGKLRVRTKVDGIVEDKSLPEVLKGYQVEQHNTRTGMQLAQEREQWQATVGQQQQELTTQLNVANNLLMREEQQIQSRYEAIDWNSLRHQDPAQYAALQADYSREMGQVRGARQEALNQYTAVQQQQAHHQQGELEKLRARESAALNERLGWTEETRAESQKKIVDYLTNGAGFQRDEVSQIFDHRVGVLADKARLWDELNAKLKSTRAKVAAAQVPRNVSGATTAQGQGPSGKARLKTAREKLKKSGSIDDAASVMANIPGLLD